MNCIICGNRIRHSYYFKMGMCGKKCYNKWRWDKLLDDKAIIIGGKCYHIKPCNITRGLVSTHYTIKMLETGEVISTNDLWYEGDIPKEYQRPDNAIFLLKV